MGKHDKSRAGDRAVVWQSALMSVGSFLAGIMAKPILGTVLEKRVFGSPEAQILSALFLLIVLIGSFTAIAWAHVQHLRSTGAEVLGELAGLHRNLGLPATLHFERYKHSRGQIYRMLTGYILQTSPGDHILLMRHAYPERENEPETKVRRQARQEYEDALLERAAQPGIIYKRIICFPEGPSQGKVAEPRLKDWVVAHCGRILQLRESGSGEIFLHKAWASIKANVVIIPGKVAVVSFDIVDHETGMPETEAFLVFRDPPHRDVIGQFSTWFDLTQSRSLPVNCVPED
jgi:hypothetical protein